MGSQYVYAVFGKSFLQSDSCFHRNIFPALKKKNHDTLGRNDLNQIVEVTTSGENDNSACKDFP